MIGLEVKKYLPIELKKTIAQGIIYDCTDAGRNAECLSGSGKKHIMRYY